MWVSHSARVQDALPHAANLDRIADAVHETPEGERSARSLARLDNRPAARLHGDGAAPEVKEARAMTRSEADKARMVAIIVLVIANLILLPFTLVAGCGG